jgi:peptide/nickel transport system ATP-binding protein
VLSYAILRILDPAARITHGQVTFGGSTCWRRARPRLQEVRGRKAAMIFQSARTALNPIRRVGAQIEDVLSAHTTTLRRT